MCLVELRSAKAGDEKILAYIQTESWNAAFRDILSPEMLTQYANIEKAEEMYRDVLARCLANVTIEFLEGQPHCIAAWSRSRSAPASGAAELICIHSLCGNWQRGYGSIMMRHILGEIKAAGFSEVILRVFEKNLRAIRFYEKHGFTPTGRKKHSYGAEEIMYAKML